ncbi:MAG: DUF2784 family protein [Calditrichaeota bacterium]|nr:MAG: DUF2784 family protein [Calditrichota bacterium]
MFETSTLIYKILDVFFLVFHSSLILFNLFGWIWRKTRKWNLLLLVLTGLSWFGLGIWYGIGYCPCTDWHWQVKWKLGQHNLPNSYVKYLIDTLTGWNVNARVADIIAAAGYFSALAASIITNLRDWQHKRSAP